jgi:hypothetical protein
MGHVMAMVHHDSGKRKPYSAVAFYANVTHFDIKNMNEVTL